MRVAGIVLTVTKLTSSLSAAGHGSALTRPLDAGFRRSITSATSHRTIKIPEKSDAFIVYASSGNRTRV